MSSVRDLRGVGPALAQILVEHGIKTVAALAKTTPEKLVQLPRIGAARAANLIAAAQVLVPKPAPKPAIPETKPAAASKPVPAISEADRKAAEDLAQAEQAAIEVAKAKARKKAKAKAKAEKAAKNKQKIEAKFNKAKAKIKSKKAKKKLKSKAEEKTDKKAAQKTDKKASKDKKDKKGKDKKGKGKKQAKK